MLRINLDDPDIMNTKEAAQKWGKKDDSLIRHRKDDFPKGTLRKIGRDWVVTREGMESVFGSKPKEMNEMSARKLLENFGIETVMHYMDQDIYNELNERNGWENDEQFVKAYLEAHYNKFNEHFVIN